ncbi:3-keto-disaccharide hydrolase [Flavobacterium maritimum]|uniref:3-keto-disaccharide hydrolase n=1 Tax=Flavobacterium maritimum TaxID=3149042 RepID=UPI0032B38904
MIKNICTSLFLMAFIQMTNAQTLPKGFKSIFDGKTTTGWHNYGKTAVGSGWKVEDGVLHFDPTAAKDGQGGDLVTDLEYTNFHLKLEWKVAAKSNSGILFYVKEDAKKYQNTYNTGLEMQVLDNEGHPDGKITKHRAGDLYDLIKSTSEPVKPVGEWNSVDIVCKYGKLTMLLNGVKVVETTLWDDNFKALVAGSKFATWEGFASFKTGRIALQDHGDNVWYRNIMIKEWNAVNVTTGCENGM